MVQKEHERNNVHHWPWMPLGVNVCHTAPTQPHGWNSYSCLGVMVQLVDNNQRPLLIHSEGWPKATTSREAMVTLPPPPPPLQALHPSPEHLEGASHINSCDPCKAKW
uniref:Uncharacterized protein n=1 Tax=Eutreptiella gymnastica TaxID=73025 RepID=A0A7S1IRL7_9EUGL